MIFRADIPQMCYNGKYAEKYLNWLNKIERYKNFGFWEFMKMNRSPYDIPVKRFPVIQAR